MMTHQKRVQTAITLGIISIITLITAIIPLYLNTFPLTTPDAGGLACGAQTLATTDYFSDGHAGNLGYNFAICWTKTLHPAIQLFNAGLLRIFPIYSWQLIPVTTLLVYLGCVWGIFWLVWRLSHSPMTAIIAAILTSASPALLRSFVLTPQNVYGYFLTIILMLLFTHIILSRQIWWWFAVPIIAIVLAFTHTLSFGIVAIASSLWFLFFYVESWLYRLVILGIYGAVLYMNERFHLLPIGIQSTWALFKSSFSGYDHPLWDHPAMWGYIITALAAVGIVLSQQLNRKIKWLLIILILIPVIFGHLSGIDIKFLPERFIPFAWISLVVFAALGLTELQKRLQLAPHWFVPIIVLLLSAQVIHGAIYIKDDVAGWSARFRPHPEFIEAVQWLNDQPNKGPLLGIMAVTNREITFAPLWYDGIITSYPWYNLDHKDIKNFKSKSALYKTIFTDPQNLEYKRVQAFYTIITKPTDPQTLPYIQEYQLQYFILPKTSQAYKIWQQIDPLPFKGIYENNGYVIYALQ